MQDALSARCDGERTGMPDDVIDAHVSGCAECQAFANSLERVNRSLGIDAAGDSIGAAPDLSAVILAGVEPQRRRQAKSYAVGLAFSRVGLGVLGLAYVGWAVALLGRTGQVLAEEEQLAGLLVDAAAVRLALAFGLLFAAWRPAATSGLLPVYGALWAFSFGFATREVVLGLLNFQDVLGLALLLVSVIVMLSTWLHNVGFSAFGRAWRALTAQPN
ncbi:zf-HC2 domain-containing protein [Corynebacterium sp.]|uniref:zf-HC2 domain-containing protein n=1 Tax=Corynebacterium sp. TaxID=1720 RepID=UPI0026DCC9F8|nr:zf-HC2 domain-containing protein [Corynebacterium sp.]MDO5076345.1 zf-HC2 domain-containing protein [Corynebacterium sp.]